MVLFKDLFQKTDNATIANSLLSGLQAYFLFEETSGNRADVLGNDTLAPNGQGSNAGIIGTGVQFNGNGEMNASDPANSIWDILSGDSTLSFWLRINDIGITQAIFGKINTELNEAELGYYFGTRQATDAIEVWIGNNSLLPDILEFPLSAIQSNILHHWVISHDAANERISIYIDGQSIGDRNYASNSNVVFDPAVPVRLGDRPGAGGGTNVALNGLIDEFGIWNKVLDANERGLLYNNGQGFAQPLFRADDQTIPVGSSSSNPTLTVTDGTTSVDRVDLINITGATITNDGDGNITLAITGSGGGTATEIRDLLQGLTDPDKLKGSAIENFRDIDNSPTDEFAPIYDLATDKILWRYVNRGIGAGAILLPLSQSLFSGADGTAVTAYVPEVGTAVYEDIKILTTAASPDNQLLNNQLSINTPNTGAVIDVGDRDTVIRTDWAFTTGDNSAVILRYESDGNMLFIDLSVSAIALKSVVADTISTIVSEAFTFATGATYMIEVQAVGLDFKVLIDDVLIVNNASSDLFLTATKFGIGRI